MNGCFFQQVLRQNLSWFCLNTGKRFILEVSFKVKRKNIVSTRYFQIALRLRDRYVFM